MRNLKKFLALVLAMMMTLSLMVTVNASSFDDDDQISPAYGEAVDVLSKLNVIKGYGEDDPNEGSFLPKNNITRAEVAAILYRLYTGDVNDDNIHLYDGFSEFTDVGPSQWFTPYVNFCANNGLIQGRGNGKFDPKGNITGYETLVMILRAIGYNDPKEFSSSDWKFKASGYGNRLGLTENIAAGSLGASAKREMVAEIMFKGILAPMVKYSPLTMYTTDLLVDAAKVNQAANATVYAKDVPNTLMYQTFGIVGKRFDVVNDMEAVGSDNYGRPSTLWVKDAATDTVDNGGKYIVNPVAADTVAAAKTNDPDNPGNALAANVAVGGSYVPATTPGATYKGVEKAALTINKTPVKTYKGTVVTECQFTTDVNDNKTIAAADITEYLNGGKVDTRVAALDINHTQEGTIGAAGRTTEVYKVNGKFIVVYVDTFMGVVTKVINRTFDTAGNHVMSDAELHVKVNDTVTAVETTDEKDFDYKAGDLVLLNTYGLKNDDGTGDTNLIDPDHIQTMVPAVATDFLPDDTDTDAYGVNAVGKPASEDVTVKGTLGTKNHKTGIEATNGNNYMANVVYLANKALSDDDTGVLYYAKAAASKGETALNDGADATNTTVPSTSPYNYGHPMVNAAINKSYTIYKDANGFVVGMTAAETASGVGVVMNMEPVRVGTGKWAIETEMMMMDGSKQTVRLVDHGTCADDGTAIIGYKFFTSQTTAEGGISTKNLNAVAGTLVKVEPFTLDGSTYYKVTETNEGRWKNFVAANVEAAYSATAGGSAVITGEADTLAGNATAGDTVYSANPTNVTDTTNTGKFVDKVDQNVDNNTKFLIAEVNWDYSLNEGNVGGYTDMDYSAYTGFKTIPTVESSQAHVKFQRIGNNVFIHPDDTALANGSLEYTIKSQTKVPDVDAYLVYATGVTYQEYSTYKALKNGEPVDLKVSNNNLTLVNKKIEAAMSKTGATLITVTSTNSKGYVTDVESASLAANKLVLAGMLHSDKTGVLAFDTDAGATNGTKIDNFYTVADDCVVKIVNLETGAYFNATLDSVSQYEKYDTNGNGSYDPDNDGHDFIIDFDELGYVDTIYIID